MRTKTFRILIWSSLASSIIILLTLVIILLVLKISWWLFGIPAIIISSSWAIFGFIFLIKKLMIPKESLKRIAVKDAIEKLKIAVRDDEDQGDNFILEDKIIQHRGKVTKTPVAIVWGRGSEKNQRIVGIINLNNANEEVSILRDPTIERIMECARLIAEDPEDQIQEQTISYLNALGVPFLREKAKVPISQAERDKINEKEALDKSAV